MSINYNINENDQKFFFENDYITINNFFDNETMNSLVETLKMSPEFWWSSSTTNFEQEALQIPYDINNANKIFSTKRQSTNTLPTGKFCYRFDRLRKPHHDTCNCNVCKFNKVLFSNELIEFCKKFTKDNTLGQIPLEPFFSRYKSGDFLSLHTDVVTKRNGLPRKLAVVIHLTKDWLPWYGGNLVLLDKSSDNIKKVITPSFNSLTLMKVEEEGVPHYVDTVISADNFKLSRYAISMWY